MAKKSVVGDVNPWPGTSDKEINFRRDLKKISIDTTRAKINLT
jgi:hypothetical protein